ncbi:RHS repeat-associated core domain-containing protein [Pseudomonas sp. NFACC13-1]|uniref:RHS repeat-associated core domain-containing protein n=1 Tax=Pseudomonas sp. NFACC13-1 TaxID=1566245 RepID=UPI000889C1B7|nr:RHS repeat-associated core domain-containing protein [Pseudomonas sp. NFACC13-1]SDB17135.1 RHS repeat-associated core domain-containing protein [Pseudomonas sp. NFACC13-1]
MPATRLWVYSYDPLDRLTGQSVSTHAPVQRFYCKSRLATEIEGAINRSIVQHDEHLLALTETLGNIRQATLVATDQHRSVLQALAANKSQSFAYSPYGHRPAGGGLLSLLGFNGERADSVTGHYLLGNGYRAFNPVLMRFNSPDRLSPFGVGGVNTYAYCTGDPINRRDPNGTAGFFTRIIKFFSKARSGTTPREVQHTTTETSVVRRIIGEQSHDILETTITRRIFNSDNQLVREFEAQKNIQIPKNPTLQELAFSKLTNYNKPKFKQLRKNNQTAIRNYSEINFQNHVENKIAAEQLISNAPYRELDHRLAFNAVLHKAKSGRLPGVDPISISHIRAKEIPPTPLDELLYRTRRE